MHPIRVEQTVWLSSAQKIPAVDVGRLESSLPRSPEEVGHSSKSVMVGRISESRTLFYRGHEINMVGF